MRVADEQVFFFASTGGIYEKEGTRDRASVRTGYGSEVIINESISPIQIATISNFQDMNAEKTYISLSKGRVMNTLKDKPLTKEARVSRTCRSQVS